MNIVYYIHKTCFVNTKIVTAKFQNITETIESLKIKVEKNFDLSKKEQIIYRASKSYGQALNEKDGYMIYTSCINLYRVFKVNPRNCPTLAKRLKETVRSFYKSHLHKESTPQLSLYGS